MYRNTNKEMVIRFISGLIIFFSIIYGYWWLTWSLLILFLFYFPNYLEIIFFGIMYDQLYGLPIQEFWNIKFIFTISSIILFTISTSLRKILIVYDDKI
ncbi:hypothetical protein EB001_09055 [bacterium]|nr:hypothetical protein [bacterium]